MAEPIETRSVSRRTVLKGVAGIAGLATVPAIIAACGPSGASTRRRARPPRAPQRRRRRRARAAPSAVATGSVSFGSNYSDAVPKAGMEAIDNAFTDRDRHRRSRSTRSTTARSRTRSATTSGARRTTPARGSPASGCGSSPPRACNATISDVWAKVGGQLHRGASSRSIGDDGKQYFIPVDYYPWAVFYRKSVFAEKGYTVPATLGRLQGAGHEDADRRPDPDRVRRQGRLARHGHVRHPQPAPQRLRLPRRPDGRQGEVDRPEGHEPSSRSGRSSCRSTRGLAGRTWQDAADTLVQKKSGMYFLGTVRLGAVRRRRARRTSTTSTSSRSRRWAPRSTPRARSTRRSTTWQIAAKSPNLATSPTPPRRSRVLGQGLDPGHHVPRAEPGPDRRRPRTPTRAPTRRSRRRRPRSSASASRSPSSSTATRARTSPARTACRRFLQTFLANPDQDLAAFQKTIQDFWDPLLASAAPGPYDSS